MSPKEMKENLTSIEDMTELEDDMIEFLTEKSSIFIVNIIETIEKKYPTLQIKKLLRNNEELEQFKDSIKDHFKWIEEHIEDEDDADIINYRSKEIDTTNIYCFFYTNAMKYIYNYIEFNEIGDELNTYFATLKKIHC